jgi:peptidoglycan/xylan/chitin deacetylase (PgdA/CDA1 family)
MTKKGKFIACIDLELAWGYNKELLISGPKFKNRFQGIYGVRKTVDKLLIFLKNHNFPIVWAIVGHLFLDHCSGHSDMPQLFLKKLSKDWYYYDPCTDLRTDPLWYGRDIVEKIRDVETPHEVASHSFSHIDFSIKECTYKVAKAEIEKSISVMNNLGIEPTSFVFPYDQVSYLDILYKNGFKAFRGPIPDAVEVFKRRRPLYQLVKKVTPKIPPVVNVEFTDGLLNIPGCMFFKPLGLQSIQTIYNKALEGINRSVNQGKIFYIYIHGHNLSENRDLLIAFQSTIKYVDELRRRGLVEICTMKTLAEKVAKELVK